MPATFDSFWTGKLRFLPPRNLPSAKVTHDYPSSTSLVWASQIRSRFHPVFALSRTWLLELGTDLGTSACSEAGPGAFSSSYSTTQGIISMSMCDTMEQQGTMDMANWHVHVHARPDVRTKTRQPEWKKLKTQWRFMQSLFCYIGPPSHVFWNIKVRMKGKRQAIGLLSGAWRRKGIQDSKSAQCHRRHATITVHYSLPWIGMPPDAFPVNHGRLAHCGPVAVLW